jgi:holo-[acyl-carrier protein] synthase
MIVGLGIDLVETERIESAWKRFGDRFVNRILSAGEKSYCLSHRNPAPFIAARFAAKEAVSKALGTGIGPLLGWQDIEVRHKESGAPYIELHGKGQELLAQLKANVVHLTLTHTAANSIAMAIVERIPNITDA